MICLNKMEESQNDQTDMSVGDKLAFIMNCQAEGKDMKKQNFDTFLDWCEQFDGAELFMHMQDFITLYLGSRATKSTPKNGAARQTGK